MKDAKINILTAVKSRKTEMALIPCNISEEKFILDSPAKRFPLSSGIESNGSFDLIMPPGKLFHISETWANFFSLLVGIKL